jgi:hypothetical protein
MPLIKYQTINLSDWKLAIIRQVNLIVAQYRQLGYALTLRQVYYQFVARDWLPKRWADPATGSTNNPRAYKNLGDIINDGRMTGLIDWHAIEDRTRELGGNQHWDSPDAIINAVARSYMIDKWEDQQYRPEVWVEKDALEDVVGRVARRHDVPFFSCRGYTSQTAMWDAGQRLKRHAEGGAKPVILHLGDHDPSGIDMSRDIEERLRLFMEDYGDDLVFERIALNMNQVQQYGPPPNPAKITDSRADKYMAKYGNDSWELDALDPPVITGLIEAALKPYRQQKKYNGMKKREEHEKELLQNTSARWEEIVSFLENGDGDGSK